MKKTMLCLLTLLPCFLLSQDLDVFLKERIAVYEKLLQECDQIEKESILLYYYLGRIDSYEDVAKHKKRDQ